MSDKRREDYITEKTTEYQKRRIKVKYRIIVIGFLSLLVALVVYISLRFRGNAMTNIQKIYDCTETVHVHSNDCYSNGVLSCGYADYVIHVHNDDCRDEEGELICKLQERPRHEHTDSCYEEVRILVCGLEEGTITNSLSDEVNPQNSFEEAAISSDEDNDGLSESEKDEATDAVQEETSIDEQQSTSTGHIHTEDCYRTEKLLICNEADIHTHTEECRDEEGNLCCGKLELNEHVHTEDCFRYEDAKKTRNVTKRYYAKTEHVMVTAIVPETANIPEKASFIVTEIQKEENPEQYTEYLEKLQEESDYEDYDITYLLSIGFYLDDNEIEPEDEVKIIIETLEAGNEINEESSIIHFDKENGTEIIEETEAEEGKLTFESGSFSVFAVVSTASRTEVFQIEPSKNSFMQTAYYDSSLKLGIAGNFHIVAFEKANIYAHCGGNILAKNCYTGSDFANTTWNNDSSARIAKASYVQNLITSAEVTSGGRNGDLFVAGDSNKLVKTDRYYIKNTYGSNYIVDGFSFVAVENSTADKPFVDLNEVKTYVQKVSEELKKNKSSNVVMTNDSNIRYSAKITDSSKPAYLNFKASELSYGEYLAISGLSNYGAYMVINVNCENASYVNIYRKFYSNFGYNSGLTEMSAGSRVLWNFYNCNGSTINLNNEVVNGTVLAPGATVNINCQLNGGIIADNVNLNTSQSHYYPYTGEIPEVEEEKTSITVIKSWENVNSKDLSDYTVEVELYRTTTYSKLGNIGDNGMLPASTTNPVTHVLTASENWTYTFNNLNAKDSQGRTIYYYVVEKAVKYKGQDVTGKFESGVSFDVSNNHVTETIKNTKTSQDITLTAKKMVDGQNPTSNQQFEFILYSWDRNNGTWKQIDSAKNNKENITFNVDITNYDKNVAYYYLIEEKASSAGEQFNADSAMYVYVVKNLYSTNQGSNVISVVPYKIKDGYSKEYIGMDCRLANLKDEYFTVVNEATFNNTTKTTDIKVTKLWDNLPDKQFSLRKFKVEVTLYKTTIKNASKQDWFKEENKVTDVEPLILKYDNNTKDFVGSFKDLPLYDSGGNRLYYYIYESAVTRDGESKSSLFYDPEYTNNDGTSTDRVITNTYITVDEYTEISVKKIWVDRDNNSASPIADSISFNLWQLVQDTDGNSSASIIDTITLDSGNNWSITIKELPLKTIENRVTYNYSYCVEEVIPDNTYEYFLLYYYAYDASVISLQEDELSVECEDYDYYCETNKALNEVNHSDIITKGEITICNMVAVTELDIEKQWYDIDGNKMSASQVSANDITVSIYQTTSVNAADRNPEKDLCVATYVLGADYVKVVEGSKMLQQIQETLINYTEYNVLYNWKFKIKNLPVFNLENEPVYYYAVETHIGELTPDHTYYSVSYDEENKINGTFIIKNEGEQVYDFLPSTGGRGTLYYRIKKWFDSLKFF